MQQGHLVALMLIVEKHFGHVFVVIASSFSHSFTASDLSLFIALIRINTATTTMEKLISELMKTP